MCEADFTARLIACVCLCGCGVWSPVVASLLSRSLLHIRASRSRAAGCGWIGAARSSSGSPCCLWLPSSCCTELASADASPKYACVCLCSLENQNVLRIPNTPWNEVQCLAIPSLFMCLSVSQPLCVHMPFLLPIRKVAVCVCVCVCSAWKQTCSNRATWEEWSKENIGHHFFVYVLIWIYVPVLFIIARLM